MGFGNLETPYVENPFAGWITKVHWRKGKPGPAPLRLVFGLVPVPGGSLGSSFSGQWAAVESGIEVGAATVAFPASTTIPPYATMSLISWSGSNIYGVAPFIKFISISPGAHWYFSVTMTHVGAVPGPFAGTASITVQIVTVDPITGLPNGVVLESTATVEPGDTVTVTQTASGVAPS